MTDYTKTKAYQRGAIAALQSAANMSDRELADAYRDAVLSYDAAPRHCDLLAGRMEALEREMDFRGAYV